VQRRHDALLGLSGVCKIAANSYISVSRLSQHFRIFTRVAARLLHRQQGLHAHKVRDDRYSNSLEAIYVSFAQGLSTKFQD
jgi:hypothetical protein